MDTPIADVPAAQPAPQEPSSAPADPFSLDEGKLAALTPEQRAAVEPVFTEWKTKAKQEIEKTGKTYQEKYRPAEEKARALDELVRDQRFVSWWQNIQKAATQNNPQSKGAIDGSKPQDFATAEEWQSAVIDASNGDHTKLQALQARAYTVMATPVIQEIRAGQAELRTTLEMRDLFEKHRDAAELDAIGRNQTDPNDGSESLLENCLNWAQANNRPLEEGYQRAKKWADAMRVGAKQEAMGMVNEKKQAVTSGPSTSKGGAAQVVEVADSDELMQKNMEYVISGQTPPKFVIRPQAPQNRDRWAQKT